MNLTVEYRIEHESKVKKDTESAQVNEAKEANNAIIPARPLGSAPVMVKEFSPVGAQPEGLPVEGNPAEAPKSPSVNPEGAGEESKNPDLNNKGASQGVRMASLPVARPYKSISEDRKTNRLSIREWGSRSSLEYIMDTCIGRGTFGTVFKGRLRNPKNKEEADRRFALKMFKLENETEGFPITGLREIAYLRKLDHENVIHFEEIITDRS